MTEIEKLWDHASTSVKEQRVNGALLEQATYICPKCGEVEDGTRVNACLNCGHVGEPSG